MDLGDDYLSKIKALHGRKFSSLSHEELEIFRFFRDKGQKFAVTVSVSTDAKPSLLASAKNLRETEAILYSAISVISVEII